MEPVYQLCKCDPETALIRSVINCFLIALDFTMKFGGTLHTQRIDP